MAAASRTRRRPDRRRATKQEGSQALARPTASKRVSSPPVEDHPRDVGRHRQAESQQQASKPHWLARLLPMEAPRTIDGARVLKIADLAATSATGRTRHYHDGEQQTHFSRLALAQYNGDDGVYLFYCDEDWNCLNDTFRGAALSLVPRSTSVRRPRTRASPAPPLQSRRRLPGPERRAARSARATEEHMRRERDNQHSNERRAAALAAEARSQENQGRF
jgi:hypothetical protein